MKKHSATCNDELNDGLEIVPCDAPSNGGAPHLYMIRRNDEDVPLAVIQFQCGPRNGPDSEDGVTHTSVIALLIHQLECFQKGPLPSRETTLLITKLEEALDLCHRRSRDRYARGVLGEAKP